MLPKVSLNSGAPRLILLSWPPEQLKAFSRAPAFLITPHSQALPADLRGMNLTVEVSKREDVHFPIGKGVPGGFWMRNGFSAVRKRVLGQENTEVALMEKRRPAHRTGR